MVDLWIKLSNLYKLMVLLLKKFILTLLYKELANTQLDHSILVDIPMLPEEIAQIYKQQ